MNPRRVTVPPDMPNGCREVVSIRPDTILPQTTLLYIIDMDDRLWVKAYGRGSSGLWELIADVHPIGQRKSRR